MDSIIPSSGPRNVADVSPREFLDVITHGNRDKAWITAVPEIEGASPSSWFGGRDMGHYSDDAGNWYYALGLIDGGQRSLDKWCAGTLVVLDDVGEKTNDDGLAVRECLGDPTFVIQTSKGSQQWGYVLTAPVTDMKMMARLQRALTLKFYPTRRDPGHERVIQYLRLPCGVNNKPKRIAENGGIAFPVRLVEWRPDVKADTLDLMQDLGSAWDETENLNLSAGNGLDGPATEEEARTYEETDVVLRGLDKLNMVRWGDVRNGYVGVTCPWHAEHTIQDDCEGYNPDSRHYQCFHSTHGPKSRADVLAWLKEQLGEEAWADLIRSAMSATFGDLPEDQSIFVSASLPVRPGPTPRARPALKWQPVAINAPSTPPRVRKMVASFVARGEVTVLASAPAGGKSALIVALAMSIANDSGSHVGEAPLDRLGDVYIVSNEDNVDDVRKRTTGWLQHWDVSRMDLKHEVYVNAVQGVKAVTRTDRYSPVVLTEEMKEIGQELEDARAAGRDVCMVVLDTAATVLENIEENDNAGMAAAMSLLTQWATDHDVGLLIAHHMPKAQGRDGGAGDMMALRGAGSIVGSARNIVTLTRLSESDEAKLPAGERDRWVKLTGAKANHSARAKPRWFWTELVNVSVMDERDPTAHVTNAMPVLVPHAKGPAVTFDPMDEGNLYAVVAMVCDAAGHPTRESDTAEPLRVRGRGSHRRGSAVIAERLGWDDDDAEACLREAVARGWVVDDIARPDARGNAPLVWLPTKEGADWVETRRREALTAVEDDECPI